MVFNRTNYSSVHTALRPLFFTILINHAMLRSSSAYFDNFYGQMLFSRKILCKKHRVGGVLLLHFS